MRVLSCHMTSFEIECLRRTILFMPRLPEAFAVWMGRIKTCDEYCSKFGVDEVRYADEMDHYLAGLAPSVIYVLSGTNTDSGEAAREATWSNKADFRVDTGRLFPHIREARVIKGPKEIEVLRHNILVK